MENLKMVEPKNVLVGVKINRYYNNDNILTMPGRIKMYIGNGSKNPTPTISNSSVYPNIQSVTPGSFFGGGSMVGRISTSAAKCGSCSGVR